MIHDAQNLFSDAQAITAAAKSTNVIDLGAAVDLGAGENLYLVAVVDVAFTDAGSDSTLAVSLETDDNSGMASPVAIQSLFTIPALAAVGDKFIARLNPAAFEQYIQLDYTPANGNLTTGSVTAFLAKDVDVQKFYADAITIS